MDEWIEVEVPTKYGGSLMVIQQGALRLVVDREEALALLKEIQAVIGEMAMPNIPMTVKTHSKEP